ncbi:dihydrofolate reductase [Priestia flexa]|uniref:dihydrofolate reductase n=1 Tax=Priestia flexa TaxID=86664 RepID=UPI00047381A9|nr:dihydrofolate reductase [Priestia flexa]
MPISLIVAAGENNEIGANNQLLCKLKGDLQYFKEKTNGSIIIMGRKTHESIGKLLPNRTNIILTSDANYELKGGEDGYIYNSFEDLINEYNRYSEGEVFVIGGESLYELFLPVADTVYLTRIHNTFKNADTYFPKIKELEWKITERQVKYEDENNDFDYTFLTYKRRK